MTSGSPTSQITAPATQTPAPQSESVTSAPPRARITAAPSRVVKCYLSIVVPAYNEEQRLPATLEAIAAYLGTREFSHELLVVDDGSRDSTREVVREFRRLASVGSLGAIRR